VASRLGWRLFLIALVVGGAVALIETRPAKLGLDLRGGTQIVLEAKDTPRQRVDDDTAERTLEVLRRRVDQLGVAEPNLQRTGPRRIIVELPGVEDPEEAVEVIGRTAQLEFRAILGIEEPSELETTPTTSETSDELVLLDEEGISLRLGPPEVTGDAVRDAQAVIDSQTGGWHVEVAFRGQGAQEWAELTGRAACAPIGDPTRRIAIVLDKDVISSPQVAEEVACNEGITGGQTVITGGFSDEEAKELALLVRAGALPVPVEVVERSTVGPTLGAQAIKASVKAALIGASLTGLYMVAYYRLLGALAVLGLLVYGAVSFGALGGIGATLTLPGVAGFVLAVGMAVDANVLVFERMKEEYGAGKRVGWATAEGFRRAWSAIADSNVTTLLAAVLLFYLASGPVRGFGVTLSLGVVVSMFSALVVVRLMIEVAIRLDAVRSRPGLLGLEVGKKLRARLTQHPPDLIGRRAIWFAISLAAVALAAAGLSVRGLNYGIEFTGGRLLEFSTSKEIEPSDLRGRLAAEGFPRALVQHTGEGNVSIRTGSLDKEEQARVESAVSSLGGGSEKVRDEFVGPTLGGELRRKALIALGLALVAQLVYLAVRFRWNFGLSAVAAMFHDLVILVGLFAWMGKEIDGVFLAALLTAIGYSVNDSVVVFDRVREQWRMRVRESLATVTNDACLQTIPRTINTGLGALLILVALFFLGGETLTDFALALIVGIALGTYSSVFTAAPLCVVIDRLRPAPPSPARVSGVSSRAKRRRPWAHGRLR